MGPYTTEYRYTDEPNPHVGRTKEIIQKYPEIKNLMGRNPITFWYILGIVLLQLGIAFLLRDQAWWLILIVAYGVGAFANHALFVLVHDCSHNMVFKNTNANIWAGILCDLPNVFPVSVGFRKYHLKHHAFQGDYHLDADLPSRWEAKLIGNGFFGKALWLFLFPVFQGLRPSRLKEIQFNSKWVWINLGTVILFDIAVVYFLGWMSFFYLAASFMASIGLHPVGARWIQEHYLVAPPQETYSYYGPLNTVAFNVGYHNEHHDFSYVPWNNLPKIKAIAPEYYDDLVYHESWSKLLWHWLTRKDLSLYSRTLRSNRDGIKVASKGEDDFASSMKKRGTEVVFN